MSSDETSDFWNHRERGITGGFYADIFGIEGAASLTGVDLMAIDNRTTFGKIPTPKNGRGVTIIAMPERAKHEKSRHAGAHRPKKDRNKK